ncbi:MAG: hypothetical protein R2748_21460 [Bryobacterales bacterium]
MAEELIRVTPAGLYCEAGDFYIDPWAPVERAVITHAHSDHAQWGCKAYLAAKSGQAVLETRLGSDIRAEYLSYGETRVQWRNGQPASRRTHPRLQSGPRREGRRNLGRLR